MLRALIHSSSKNHHRRVVLISRQQLQQQQQQQRVISSQFLTPWRPVGIATAADTTTTTTTPITNTIQGNYTTTNPNNSNKTKKGFSSTTTLDSRISSSLSYYNQIGGDNDNDNNDNNPQEREEAIKSFLLSLQHVSTTTGIFLPMSSSTPTTVKGKLGHRIQQQQQQPITGRQSSRAGRALRLRPSPRSSSSSSSSSSALEDVAGPTVTESAVVPPLIEEEERNTVTSIPSPQEQQQQQPSSSSSSSLKVDTTLMMKQSDTTTTSNNNNIMTMTKQQLSNKLESQFKHAMKERNIQRGVELLDISYKEGIWITKHHVSNFFFIVVDIDPFLSYKVMNYYNNHPQIRKIKTTTIKQQQQDENENEQVEPTNEEDDEGQLSQSSQSSQQQQQLKPERHPAMYRRICKAVRLIDPKVHYRSNIHEFVSSLLQELDELDDIEIKQQSYPKLVLSLVSQRSVTLGQYAKPIYQYMMDHNFPISDNYLLALITLSKYNRQDDLPFYDILSRLAKAKRCPHPPIALKVVQNMFPYSNPETTMIALQAILDFQRNTTELSSSSSPSSPENEPEVLEEMGANDNNNNMKKEEMTVNETTSMEVKQQPQEEEEEDEDDEVLEVKQSQLHQEPSKTHRPIQGRRLPQLYNIDMGTLEAMSASAARNGHSRLIFTIWDVMDALGYQPTEAIYENSIVAFASRRSTLCNAFAAMEAMKADGFSISRALIRSISHSIRSNRYLLHEAWSILSNPTSGEESGIVPSLEAFNVILSGYAERGDVKHAMYIFRCFSQFGLEPNADSYSFAMEVLGKDVHRRIREDRNKQRSNTVGQALLDKNIDAADEVLTMMEQKEIIPSADVIRNYVELLCLAGEVGTATAVVKDFMASDETKSAVNNKAIYRVAIANADIGEFELANQLAVMTSEHIPMLHRIVDSKEQRHRNLEQIKLRKLQQEKAAANVDASTSLGEQSLHSEP